MRIVVELDFFADGLDEENVQDVRDYVQAMIDSGAESTASDAWIDGIHVDDGVVISKEEYGNLLESVGTLECLEACGVDNWVGYSDAMRMKAGEDDEEWE